MTCQEIVDFLMAYVDGEMPADQAAIFAHHIEVCPECLEYLESYQQTVTLAKVACGEETPAAARNPPIPDELVRAILAARARDKGMK